MQRLRVRKSPADFAESITGGAFKRPWHIEAINQKLLDVYNGKTKRLIISVPVRHGKSELVSKYTTAWWLMMRPTDRVVIAGYGSEFASEWGRKSRDIVEEHGHLFDVHVDSKSASASRWNIDKYGGGLYAVGVGSSLTGRGANCFVADTKVMTENGYTNIQDILPGTTIASYNQATESIEWQVCQAVKRSQGHGIYRITTAAGRVVEVTGDHLIYTEDRGWTSANQLASGDHILCMVQKNLPEIGMRHEQVLRSWQTRRLLLAALCTESSRNQEPTTMREVRRTLPEENNAILQQLSSLQGPYRGPSSHTKGLQHLQCRISGAMEGQDGRRLQKVLQSPMCQRGSLAGNDWQEQSSIYAWRGLYPRHSRVPESMEAYSGLNLEKRPMEMCSLFKQEEIARTSSRCGLLEQYEFQPSHLVRTASSGGPSIIAEDRTDRVAMVERVREEDTVYDIQVAENHNFFANGVLVHNCMIIDDPHKDAAEARSSIVRESVWDWYLATASTRLEPGGAIVVVMARWHADDLAGKLLENDVNGDWEILHLPAIAEYDEDFRKVGDPLWPERYDIDALLKIKRQSEFWFAALYQGRPAPEDGNVYRKSGERVWARGNESGKAGYALKKPNEKGEMVYDQFVPEDRCWNFITVDLAVSEKQTADYTVMCVWAATPNKQLILLDMVRSHMTGPEKVPTMQRLKDRYSASYLAIERFGYQLETIQNARWAGLPVHESAMKGDKVAKSWEASAKWESGQIYLPEGAAYLDDIRMELYAFPNATHDDIADCFSIAASEASKAGDPLEAMGVAVCHRCKHKFIRNAKVGLDRPCPRCGSPPETPSLTTELEPHAEPNSLS